MPARPDLRPLVELSSTAPASRIVSASGEPDAEADEIAELIAEDAGEPPPEPT